MNPFFYYSDNFPAILNELKGTIVYSTYQAGKLIFISSPNGKNIAKYAKNFKRPMGLAYDRENKKLAVASRSAIDIFSTEKLFSLKYPKEGNKYDAVFIPQVTYQTGMLDTHEIAWYNDNILFTNTLFSNLSLLSQQYHFQLFWKPEWIQELGPDDMCHLNGLCFENSQPKYVTCFAKSAERYGWKNRPYDSGLLIDIATNEVILDGLAMPHSPIVIDDEIYLIESATGKVIRYNRKNREKTELNQFDTFLRGMDIYGDYIFIGASKIRQDSSFFNKIPIKSESSFSGIIVLDRKTGKKVAGLTYTDHISELFSIKFLPDILSPAILTDRDEHYNLGIMSENSSYWIKKNK